MKILIAHDWEFIRSGIRQILCDEFGPLEITQVTTGVEGFDLATGPWDVAFVDVDAPDDWGLHFVRALKRAHPSQRVLGVSPRAKISHLGRALKKVIRGSITLESTRDELVTAARSAIGEVGHMALKDSRIPSKTAELSKRELGVLRLVAAGKSIKEVARVLNVSASTVSTYRVRMLRKLRLGSTGELIRYALMHHLAD